MDHSRSDAAPRGGLGAAEVMLLPLQGPVMPTLRQLQWPLGASFCHQCLLCGLGPGG